MKHRELAIFSNGIAIDKLYREIKNFCIVTGTIRGSRNDSVKHNILKEVYFNTFNLKLY
jgi:hypothetical protein